MKKEKRKLTLEQLEREKKFFERLSKILVILFFLMIIFIVKAQGSVVMTIICIVIELLLYVMILLSDKVSDKIENKIKKQMKLEFLKQLVKEHGGNIKAFVSIMDEKVITDILSKNIEKIVIDFTQDLKVGITTIYFSNDGPQSGVRILKENLIFLLNEKCKKKILNSCVESIKLTEFGENKKQIVISGPGFCYVDEKASEDELLEMFELKE